MEFVVGWLVLSVVVGVVASARGRSGFGYFLLAAVLSPLVGLVLALALPAKFQPVAADPDRPTPETHVRCPDCRELVRADARKCKHCGAALVPRELQAAKVAPAPAQVMDRAASVAMRMPDKGMVLVALVTLCVVVFIAATKWPSKKSSSEPEAENAALLQHCETNRDALLAEAERKLAALDAAGAVAYLKPCADATNDQGLLALMDRAQGATPSSASNARSSDSAMRFACKEFMTKSPLVPTGLDLGEWHRWTVTKNDDGTFSVGARHSRGYHTCVMRQQGDSITLQSLTRMM